MSIKKQLLIPGLLFLSLSLLLSCTSSGGENNPEEAFNPPGKASGILPANGESCTTYEEVIGNSSKVLITFKWDAAQFAQNYELVVLDGNNEITRQNVIGLETKQELDRGKTYTWAIVSINDDGITPSDTYSFTTPGIQVGNYAPYAAEIQVDFDTINMEMTISWTAKDEDGDTLTFDVKVLENGESLLEEVDYPQESLSPITIISQAEYTIEVVSKDALGNYSVSKTISTSPE